MARVAIAGYIVGFRFRENDKGKRYGVVDLMQFGSLQSDTEIINLLVYDHDLQVYLNQRFIVGQIRPASFICNLSYRDRSLMWFAEKITGLEKSIAVDDANDARHLPGESGGSSE